MQNPIANRPPILYGAALLALLSLTWSGYAITDLMHSGKFGLSVALAGDIGWVTVLWAEYRGITISGRTWAAPAAGWAIALGVATLLALHGHEAGSSGQAIAGPFVVLIGKAVWTFAIAALADPAALTAEQEAEIHSVMRDSEHAARLHEAELKRTERDADAEIARIRAEARIVLARDDADFEIGLERSRKRAEIARRTPLAISPANSEHDSEQEPNTGEPRRQYALNHFAERYVPVDELNSTNSEATIADLVREQVAITPNNTEATDAIMRLRPAANRDSVGAAVRRARREADSSPYT